MAVILAAAGRVAQLGEHLLCKQGQIQTSPSEIAQILRLAVGKPKFRKAIGFSGIGVGTDIIVLASLWRWKLTLWFRLLQFFLLRRFPRHFPPPFTD